MLQIGPWLIWNTFNRQEKNVLKGNDAKPNFSPLSFSLFALLSHPLVRECWV